MFRELNNLKLFFEDPNRQFHLRELARLLKRNPVTVKGYLKEFVRLGAIIRKKERNLELYSSNAEGENYKEYKKIYNIFKLRESGLLDFLKKSYSLPTIIVFGSYTRGEDSKNSDVDIFILSEVKPKIDLWAYEKKIGRPLQLHAMTKKEFEAVKMSNPDLVNNIANGFVLSGFLEVV